MKEGFITNIEKAEQRADKTGVHVYGENLIISDGFHTMDELYDHRITLFIQICKTLVTIEKVKSDKVVMIQRPVWRSKLHHDGSSYEGWFILGINKEAGMQITYHLPISRWEETNFAETLEKCPEFDGHSSPEVLERLKNL